MPTRVLPSGVMVGPSMPLFTSRLASSAGSEPLDGDSRSSARPSAAKWVM